MGLDTSHGCWHGAYSAFHRWRLELARVAGIPMPLMDSFWSYDLFTEGRGNSPSPVERAVARYETPSPFSPSPSGGFVATRTSLQAAVQAAQQIDPDVMAMQTVLARILPYLPLSWDVLAPDPLIPLLNHSDCDGEIAAVDRAPLADRLAELLPLLPDGGPGGHIPNWRDKTQTFIDGLRVAAAAGEAVEFH